MSEIFKKMPIANATPIPRKDRFQHDEEEHELFLQFFELIHC